MASLGGILFCLLVGCIGETEQADEFGDLEGIDDEEVRTLLEELHELDSEDLYVLDELEELGLTDEDGLTEKACVDRRSARKCNNVRDKGLCSYQFVKRECCATCRSGNSDNQSHTAQPSNNLGEVPAISQPANRGNLPIVDVHVFVGQTFAQAIGNSMQDFFDSATNHLRSLNYHPNWVIHSKAINDRGRGNRFSLAELRRSVDKPFPELLENIKNEAERLGVSSGPRAYLTSTHWKATMGGSSFGCMLYGVTAAGPNLQGQQLVNRANTFAHEVAHSLGLQGPLPADILDELEAENERVRESLEGLGEKRRFYHPFWRHLPGNDAAARYWKQQARTCLNQPGNSYPAR
jgi:hypothetical protein